MTVCILVCDSHEFRQSTLLECNWTWEWNNVTPLDKIKTRASAKILSTASDFYVKAAEAIEAGETEDTRYMHIKSAKDLIEDAFPEVFEVKRPSQKYLVKEANEYKAIKLITLIVVVLGICYSLVVFGPTGDLSKTWTTDDVAKSTAYPKQPN